MNIIEFSIDERLFGVMPEPVPAKKMVPSWYKRMSPFVDQEKKFARVLSLEDYQLQNNSTMKACIPIRDSIVSGYTLTLPVDVMVNRVKKETPSGLQDELLFSWGLGGDSGFDNAVEGHSIDQIKNSPLEQAAVGEGLYKFNSPWRIKTPPGYSCYFYSPPYHNLPYEVLPAIVDTDGIHEVNFPFIWKTKDEAVKLKKGLPMIQLYPFKREEWKSEIKSHSSLETLKDKSNFLSYLGNWYRDFVHKKKRFD